MYKMSYCATPGVDVAVGSGCDVSSVSKMLNILFTVYSSHQDVMNKLGKVCVTKTVRK